jgi:hypothetical protein
MRREIKTTLAECAALRRRHCELERTTTVLQPFIDAQAAAPQFVPPGHFYSAVPPLTEVRPRASRIFDRNRRTVAGVDLREAEQLALLERFAEYYRDHPFTATEREDRRYFFENPFYSYSDALFLHCMLRHIRPKRVIEVGSGYSSAATLDTCELFLGNEVDCTFIEPYTDSLRSMLKRGDTERIHVIEKPLQDVPVSLFQGLTANDILFIDSTHVSAATSTICSSRSSRRSGRGSSSTSTTCSGPSNTPRRGSKRAGSGKRTTSCARSWSSIKHSRSLPLTRSSRPFIGTGSRSTCRFA